jgi:alpha-galactosidase
MKHPINLKPTNDTLDATHLPEVMRHFGYFMTESTGHLSEYLPYFRKNQKALDLYCDEPGFGGETGAYYNWCKYVAGKYNGQQILDGQPTALPPRSVEYGSYIIEGLETGRIYRGHFNRVNRGCIANLPSDCVVEAPGYVDGNGISMMEGITLPLGCAAVPPGRAEVPVGCIEVVPRAPVLLP